MNSPARCLILIVAGAASLILGFQSGFGQDLIRQDRQELLGVPLLGQASLNRNDRFFDAPWIGYDTAVYPEGLWPYASVVADFNGDGVPDLAASAWGGTPWFSVLIGDGLGGFEPPNLYPLQLEAQDLVAEDFDRDGDIDLAIAESGRRWEGLFVSLWYNDGSGGFFSVGVFATGDDGPSGITSADFNNDGWMDVAVAHDEYIGVDNTISILLNDTQGRFEPPQVIQLSSGTNDLEAGDTDGDGDADIVVAHENNFWTLVQNNGNGSFQQIGTFTGIQAGSIPADPTVHIADIDLDGDNDVLFSNQDSGGFGDGAIGLWRNDGAGGFPAAEEISLLMPLDPNTSGGTDINTADVTHDGWPDILVCNGYWFLIEGDGTGGFLPPRLFHAGDGSIDSKATDLDLDGDLDVIIIGRGSLEACVYLNPGHGEFIQPTPLPMADPIFAPAFPSRMRVDDIDDDGDLDIVSGYRSDFSERHALTVRRNNGDGTFAAIEEYLEPTYPLDLVLADMDNDGHEDLLYVLNGGRFYIRVNDGAGNFGPPLGRHFLAGQVNQLEAEDLDNDGDLDVIVDAGFGIDVSLNNGGLNFSPPFNTGCDQFVDAIDFGDFNEDGILDLLTNSGEQGYPTISFGNGDGTFGDCFTVPTGRDVHAFDVADLDGDGHLDFVSLYNLDEMGLGLRRGRGDGNFFPGENYPGAYYFGDHTSTVDLADFNGDGVLDAVTASFGAQDFSFWQGLGTTAGANLFLDDVRYGVGWAAYDIEPGDFDGDGILDVAVMCQIDNGRWFYPGVVIMKGIGQPVGQTAPLTDLQVTTGTLLNGGLPELSGSDDSYVHTRSGFGQTLVDLHHMEMRVTATTTINNPTNIDLTIEDRIDQPAGQAQVRLRNWSNGVFDLVGSYAINQSEQARPIEGIDATQYVNATGQIEVSIKHIVFVPFLAFTFESFIDEVRIDVR